MRDAFKQLRRVMPVFQTPFREDESIDAATLEREINWLYDFGVEVPGADLIRGIVALWKTLHAGDERRIYALSQPISSLIAVQNSLDAFLAIEKYLLMKQGIFTNPLVLGPVGYVLDEETRREIDRLFDQVMQAVEAT